MKQFNTRTKKGFFLSADEEATLINNWKVRGCRRSQATLVDKFKPLTDSLASRMRGARNIDIDDLKQVAVVELLRALDDFDLDRGYRFGTLAQTYIVNGLSQYIKDNMDCVRWGTNTEDKALYVHLSRSIARWERDNGRPFDNQGRLEIAAALNVDIRNLLRAEARLQNNDLRLNQTLVTRDSKTDNRDIEVELADANAEGEKDILARMSSQKAAAIVRGMIKGMNDRDRYIMEMRLLKAKEDRPTRAVIAEKFGISRERVRQIEEKSTERLRRDLINAGITPQTDCYL